MKTHWIALIGGLLLYSCVHSLLVAPRLRQALERFVPPRTYRLFYNLVATLLLGALWITTEARYPVLWDLHGLPALLLRIVQAGALLLFLVALAPIDLLYFLGWRQLQGHAEERQGLVTRGAYALCRHPLYFAACVFFSAWPRMDLRWFILAIWLWLYCSVGSLFEERRLEAQFGQAYRDYRRECPRLLPVRLRKRRKT